MLSNAADHSGKKALVLNIQRMSTEDGPGLRTTVFFKGCSLACAWCHNPESIRLTKEILWVETKCIGCQSCLKACSSNALSMTETGLIIERDKCIRCLSCAKDCPTTAIEIKGEEWDLDKLVLEVIKDRAYFEKSGGGISVSGGEALVQSDFIGLFFQRLKQVGIHTVLDTCGVCSKAALERVLPYTDLVLFDIKLMDPVLHRNYTGASNEVILDNLLYLADRIRKNKRPAGLWIRTPVIPDATAQDENIKAIGRFISENIKDVTDKWELCAFNNLCRDKYRRLNLEWLFNETELIRRDDMIRFADLAKDTGVNPQIVCWSGPTRVEDPN